MKRLGLILLLLLIMMPSTAQDQRTLDRIDQAMAHLTSWLDREAAPITRTTHSWQWQEAIYGDASFDCGLPGVEYPITPNRAFQVNITVDDITYDYRVSGDGTILVLCGADGVPLYRSDAPIEDEETDGGIPGTAWYAMVYSSGTDLIRLFNADGLQATIKRPEVPNEMVPPDVTMAVSPNGRYLVQNIVLASGSNVLSLYDIRTGTQRTIAPGVGETLSLGAAGSLIFSADSSEVAVTYATLDVENNSWRVAVIDLETGTLSREITAAGLIPILTSGDANLTNAINGTSGVFFPQVAYFDAQGGVHVRMILWFAGGTLNYPTFEWVLDSGVANLSPYSRIGADILDGVAVYAYFDANRPSLPQDGMFPPSNVIARGTPSNTVLQQTDIHTDGNFELNAPRWAADGDLVVFNVSNAQITDQFAVVDAAGTGIPFTLLPQNYEDVIGTGDGFLALTTVGEAGSDVIFHEDNIPGPLVYTVPPQNGEADLIWALPANTTFGVDSIAVNDLISLPPTSVYLGTGVVTAPDADVEPLDVEGTVVCAGTPPSRLTVGGRARVTVINGTPLNVRTGPGTANAIVDVIAEGTEFDIIGGPECADGFTWYRLQIGDTTFAWGAEGDTDDYFLEPIP